MGRNPIRAIPDALDGVLLSGQHISAAGGEWLSPSGGVTPTDKEIEGIIVKALAANTGTIYITEVGKPGATQGFPLAKSESVSIGTDNFDKVRVWIATAGDGFAYLAIETVIK